MIATYNLDFSSACGQVDGVLARAANNQKITMNEPSNRVSEISQLKELVRLLGSLLEAAQRLPQGAERQAAFEQMSDFQRRLAALIRQSSEAH